MMMLKSILRSIGAVIGGSLTIGVLSFITGYLMGKIRPDLMTTIGRNSQPAVLAFMATYSVVFAGVGGYVTASLAQHAPMKHVIALAVFELVVGTAAAINFGDLLPTWFSVTVDILPVPAILLAGAIRSRTCGPAHGRSESAAVH